MIPATKETAVKQALHVTFGVNEFEDIRQLTTGLSTALVFRILVLKKPYLLRIITRTDLMGDPTHEYACMQAAADAGIAPKVLYTNITDRIAITDFVETTPFPREEARIKLPDLLKRLHSLPPFPFRVNYLDAADGFFKKFQAANILPEHMTAELFRQYARMINIYPRNAQDMVACHNDLKPENTLFDGNKVWLVDWEAAFLNDRYLDLAIVANFVVTNEQEEKEYLTTYFGKELNEYHHARFFLMSQLLHLFYFAYFLLICSNAGVSIDPGQVPADFKTFHDDIWAGKISLADSDARQQYAFVHMQRLLHNLQLKRWEDSLQLVADYQWL
ncbi:phosphotransferase [Chitinophaga sp. RAB17]|uniref:phosphotransferase n=1 Tax=Chitinophaga sp. RAB17 TaxID=3233049 RepID=UPI003F8E1D81